MPTEVSNPDIINIILAESAKMFEFYKAPKFIELGRESAQKCIRELKMVTYWMNQNQLAELFDISKQNIDSIYLTY